MKKKYLALILSVLLVAVVSVMGTLAYLTDTDSVVNTFTVGDVKIDLDETDVDKNGTPILDDEGNPVERVKNNEYHLIPGKTYVKDPMITVKASSEESYIRMMVTMNCLKEWDAIFSPEGANLAELFGGYDNEIWKYIGVVRDETTNTITYEFRYKETVTGGDSDVELEPLFETLTLPGEITGEELATLSEFAITVEGHAIQAAGFAADETTGETAEDIAWKAFDKQMSE